MGLCEIMVEPDFATSFFEKSGLSQCSRGLRETSAIIFTQDVALFRFRGTRKMRVAEEVFGEGDHIGVLVRDRFPGYDNSFKGKQQYCFEHLKRDCKELLEKEPQNAADHRVRTR